MILELVCAHCDSLMAPEAKACARCGAPSLVGVLRTPEAEAGYQLYQDAWHGMAILFPAGWSARPGRGSGAVFVSEGGGEELELNLLPGGLMLSAEEYAQLFLRSLPDHRSEMAGGSTPEYCRAVFEGPLWSGALSVHLTARGGTLGVARRRPGSALDLEPALARMLASLSPIRPIPRQSWLEPSEQSFRIECPVGWDCRGRVQPTREGMRQPVGHVSADRTGQVFVAVEGQFQNFVHADPRSGGFMGGVPGAMFGDVACPFQGLWPAVQSFFLPHWQRQYPSCQLLAFHEEPEPGETARASVHLLLPDDVVLVYLMMGMPFPYSGMGAPRWMGGHLGFYRAPAALMGKFAPILRGIADSYQQQAAWRQREQGVADSMHQGAMDHQRGLDFQRAVHSQGLHAARMNGIAMAGQANAQIHANRQVTADGQVQSWRSGQDSSDHIQRGSVHGINETADYLNSGSGAVHTLSHHYANYWDTGRDLIVGSNLTLQPPPDWTPLQLWDGPRRG